MMNNNSHNPVVIRTGNDKYSIEATIVFSGKDISVVFSGGEKPHIGATAIALPRPSLDYTKNSPSSSASVICVLGHKEDLLARKTALSLAAKYNCVVCVTIGLHVDRATQVDIDLLEENFDNCLQSVIEMLDSNISRFAI